MTKQEKILIKINPAEAIIIYNNREKATDETQERWGFNGRNDKSDAFRHSFFNAINTKYCGMTIVKLFSNAHESEVPQNLSLEVSMDLFNNLVGINYVGGISLLSESSISATVSDKILEGEMKYLSPLDAVVPPNFGINFQTNLIPTNQ